MDKFITKNHDYKFRKYLKCRVIAYNLFFVLQFGCFRWSTKITRRPINVKTLYHNETFNFLQINKKKRENNKGSRLRKAKAQQIFYHDLRSRMSMKAK